MTEIPTDGGKLYQATVIDLFSRRLLGYATSPHPDAVLTAHAIKMAVATRGGDVAGVIFHTDRGSTYTAGEFTALCRHLASDNQWVESVPVSTTRLRNHSSRPLNMKSYLAIISPHGLKRGE